MAKPYIPHEGPVVTRAQAQNAGELHYFSGKPCKHGHISRRLVSNPGCAECVRIAGRLHKQRNREANNAKDRLEYAANREKKIAKSRRWNVANKDIVAARESARRATAKNATPIWADKLAIRAIFRKCSKISEDTGIPHHVDHIYPLQSKWVCGLHCEANLQIRVATDNQSKNNRYVPELIVIDGKPLEERRQGNLFLWYAA